MSTTDSAPGTAIAPSTVGGWLGEALEIDNINAERLSLIKSTVAKDASTAEVGMFLELAAKYDLDPFAKEIWCVKSGNTDGGSGRLLIMVGRDGLRKIAKRANIHIDGDVVHEHDEFTIKRTPDGNRTVEHTYSDPSKRGEIIGAWAECRAGGPLGAPLGFFYAAIAEYMPTNAKKLQYSPWGSQKSVMILAAAERQALRQATPLSGLLVEGEGEINEEKMLGTGSTPADPGALLDAVREHVPEQHADKAMELMLEMNELAAGSWTPGKVNMVFAGKTPYAISVELGQIERQIEELRAAPAPDEAIADAEIVEEPAAQDGAREADQDDAREETPAASPRELTADEQKKSDRVMVIQELLDEDDALSDDEKSDLEAERDSLEGELPPDVGPGQEHLPL